MVCLFQCSRQIKVLIRLENPVRHSKPKGHHETTFVIMKKLEDWINGKTKYILIGIVILGAALRLYHINYQSLWLDELYSIVPTDPQNSLVSIIEYAKGDQPPLFFIYIHYVFALFGYNELVGRTACAFIGLIGILAIYFLGKECHGKAAGLFAAFLTGLNYFHIYYSQELRFYSMVFLFAVLSYLFFIRAFKRNKTIDFIGYAIFTVFLLYTHYFGIIIFLVQVLTFFFLLIYKRDFRFIVSSIISGIAITIAFIPWMPIVINDSDITSGWIKRPDPFFVVKYFYDYTGKDVFTTLVFLIFIFLFIKSMETKNSLSNESKPIYLTIILWIVFSYLLPYVWSIANSPLLHQRYTIVTLPALILLFALGWDRIRNNKWKYALPPMLAMSLFINMIFFKQHYTKLEKDQFREASEVVKSNNKFHYPIYSVLSWHFNFYFRDSADTVNSLYDSDLSSIETFWLLQAHYTPDEMEAETGRLSKNFIVVEKYSLYGANALLMKRK